MLRVGQKPRSRAQSLEGLLASYRHKKLLRAMICTSNLENCLRDVGHWSHRDWEKEWTQFHAVISLAINANTNTTGNTQGRQSLHSQKTEAVVLGGLFVFLSQDSAIIAEEAENSRVLTTQSIAQHLMCKLIFAFPYRDNVHMQRKSNETIFMKVRKSAFMGT